MKEQIKNQTTNIEVDGVAPDVAELLRQIREQYEQMVMKNRSEAEEWYKSKVRLFESKINLNFSLVVNECDEYLILMVYGYDKLNKF